MRIAQKTATTLVLKDDASKSFFFGGVLTLLGLLGLAFSGFKAMTSGIAADQSGLVVPGIAAAMFIVGLIILLLARIRSTMFDKSQDSIQLIASGLLGKKVTERKISDMARVELRSQYVSGGSGGPHENYRIALVAKDGSEFFLDAFHDQQLSMTAVAINMSGVAGMGREHEIGQKVATFLGVPFLDGNPINAGLGSIPGIGAILK